MWICPCFTSVLYIFVFLIVCVGSINTKVLRKIFESTHEDITGEWKELYSAKLHNFCNFIMFRPTGSRTNEKVLDIHHVVERHAVFKRYHWNIACGTCTGEM
jgi:hypothetical protein